MAMASVWLWGRRADIAVFGGSALFALVIAGLSPWLSEAGALPTWAWFVFVLGLDVAHVWTTLFRTYLDREELARRRGLYLGLPLACYLVGVALHAHSPLTFWRVLAYAAVFHFVRQQAGWVAIYRVKAAERARLDRWVDNAAIYAASCYPLLVWHASLPRKFYWFVPADFVRVSQLRGVLPLATFAYALALLAYLLRAGWQLRRGHHNWGKHLVVVTTVATWLVGIVLVNEDFTFTVTNVTVHAIPYVALLWVYTKQRGQERPQSLVGWFARRGVIAFMALALGFAFAEEFLWERLIWHDRPGWFGGAAREIPLLDGVWRTLLVPLLALPQAVHYALDGVLWRGKDAGPAQARALGFEAPSKATVGRVPSGG